MTKTYAYQAIMNGIYGKKTTRMHDSFNEIAEHMLRSADVKRWNEQTKRILTQTLIHASNIENIDTTFPTKIVNLFDMKYVIVITEINDDKLTMTVIPEENNQNVKCPSCNGHGYQDDFSSNTTYDKSMKAWVCALCKGSGEIKPIKANLWYNGV